MGVGAVVAAVVAYRILKNKPKIPSDLGSLVIPWGARVRADFKEGVIQLCRNLGWDPDTHAGWLMACMAFETGGSFSPSVKNPRSSATGLIQFMRDTATSLGTTVEKLARMSAVQQLRYVELYFRDYAPRIRNLGDMYMAIFAPKGIGKPDSFIVYPRDSKGYAPNRELDKDGDGIERGECVAMVARRFEEGLQCVG